MKIALLKWFECYKERRDECGSVTQQVLPALHSFLRPKQALFDIIRAFRSLPRPLQITRLPTLYHSRPFSFEERSSDQKLLSLVKLSFSDSSVGTTFSSAVGVESLLVITSGVASSVQKLL